MIADKQVATLFEGEAPLSTFSSKIKLVYFFGLIPQELYRDLNLVRKIRNKFAHELDRLSFQDQSIADTVRALLCLKRFVTLFRQVDKEKLGTVEESANFHKLAEVNEDPRNLWNLGVGVLAIELDRWRQACKKAVSPHAE
jgi:DNA-binding MltR family transcriptional regulator